MDPVFTLVFVIFAFLGIIGLIGTFVEVAASWGDPYPPFMIFILSCIAMIIMAFVIPESKSVEYQTVVDIKHIEREAGVTYVYGRGVSASNNTALVYLADTNRLVLVRTDVKKNDTVISSRHDVMLK